MSAAPQARKQPTQRRAIETFAAIVEAAARILETGDAEALNTNRIAERAGVSVGTLYQYFPDKHAILVALIRREREVLLSELRAIQDGGEEVLQQMVDVSIRHQFARPRLAAALEHIEASFPMGEEADEMAREIASISSGLLARRFGPLDPTDLLTAVIIARSLVNAAGEGLLPEAGLRERVVKALEGYLRAVSSRD
ncbi:TetR/AcrR family transcriptional regulator [Pseudooceanicola sp. HF7]|uniref:TetR/AcrR family transcriptional regulator n=1 Tax=Pseudooceanicola sp. HF7 TaxID=2721560 RepID=UPI001431368A|nr:TetR/AcrR family transcriptional regulator [Pseudooceanicola sp. HF7]NIZ10197.1 TetR/AcrR family transcriptional regulator [Pseudooceanicola sp. HF7]